MCRIRKVVCERALCALNDLTGLPLPDRVEDRRVPSKTNEKLLWTADLARVASGTEDSWVNVWE